MASPQRKRHQINQSLVSDFYDSDAHFLSDIPPPPAERTDEELNLSVLRRYRQDVASLEYVVPYVVVYTFSPESLSWEKSGMEGSTFLCGLQPNSEYSYRCAVIVLNRRSLENLNIELRSSEDVDITEEYIILKNENQGQTQFYGLWVFREPPPSSTAHHPEAFAQKVQECAKKAESSRYPQKQERWNAVQENEDSVPMGRQISLRELFGRQRQEDDTWSVKSHGSSQRAPQTFIPQQAPPIQQVPQQQQQQQHQPQFVTSPDTDFFLSGSKQMSSQLPAVAAQNQQRDSLLDLFKKASEKRG
jgi:hypothetical protein